MAIVLRWFRAFRWSYWRRCKVCGVRGGKCLCKRPSLAMEQIFFIEERKNKFGVRNFSHVSDTAVTASSGSFSTGTSFGEDYRAGDFYRSTQQQSMTNNSTAIVRKNSGAMVSMNGPHGRSYSQDDANYGYGASYGCNDSYNGYYGSEFQRQHRQLPPSTSSSRNEDSALTLHMYNRKHPRAGRSASRGSTRMSNGDSIVVRPSSSSSVRASVNSDRMSIDNNTGSFNPRGRYFEGSYAPSIQEDDDDVQGRLNGLLQLPSPASSTSTMFDRSRYHQYY